MENLMSGLRRLEASMESEVAKKNPLRMQTLKKLTSYLLGTDKPKRERLDRLSLLLGFQNWDSLHEALTGQADGETNYEPDSTAQTGGTAQTAEENGTDSNGRKKDSGSRAHA